MEAYDVRVAKIESIPLLGVKVQDFAGDSLNLAVPNWKDKLEASDMYKVLNTYGSSEVFGPLTTHELFPSQNIVRNNMLKSVIVVGMCRISMTTNYPTTNKLYPEKLAISIQECTPLQMLGEAWTSDKDSNQYQLQDNVRANFNVCSFCCQLCSRGFQELKAVNPNAQFPQNQPCFADISIYNGKSVDNIFGFQLQTLFPNPNQFLAIIQLELNCRYFFKNNSNPNEPNKWWTRIGGKVQSMVAFPESNLLTKPKISLNSVGLLTCLENMEATTDKKQVTMSTEDEVYCTTALDDGKEEEIFNVRKKQKLTEYGENIVEEMIDFN